ncbi:hypothetical protein HDC92_000013 [Pedobacter sp. AK017]|uniref:protein-disulfide reductase DsbD N-terminal domain-containing protein n=1 Tax=Pedobacter sp. AK017 TaxID=2723073 RepID=UPI00161FFC79|nr:protein-disulfide reductase DsbD N-terminal domain-containing protein [Pedobacter sp. AK017]MBB5436349.1 hypothetical protein [Pedobacter sp. AK017]
MKKLLMMICLCLFAVGLQAQGVVRWSYSAKKLSATEAVLYMKASIGGAWHLYSVNQPEGGPMKTSFTFEPSADYALVGKVTEPKPKSMFDQNFGIEVLYFEKEVVFEQKVKLKNPESVVKGRVEFMACDDSQCLPPEEKEFSIVVK